jgi:hypothetical protein
MKRRKPTITDFIKMHEVKRYNLEQKAPTKKALKEWFYLSGIIDGAKTIKRTCTMTAVLLMIAGTAYAGQDFTVNDSGGSQQVCTMSQGQIYCR